MKTLKMVGRWLTAALISLFEPLYIATTNWMAKQGLVASLMLDANLIFDGTQSAAGVVAGVALTASATSSNIVDLINARDMGTGEDGNPPRLLVLVMTALVSAGSTTLVVTFDGSTDSSTWTTYAQTPAIPKATLIAGAMIFNITLPGILPGGTTPGALPRYLRTNYTVAVSNFTGGTIFSAIVLGRDTARAYPPGVTVNN